METEIFVLRGRESIRGIHGEEARPARVPGIASRKGSSQAYHARRQRSLPLKDTSSRLTHVCIMAVTFSSSLLGWHSSALDGRCSGGWPIGYYEYHLAAADGRRREVNKPTAQIFGTWGPMSRLQFREGHRLALVLPGDLDTGPFVEGRCVPGLEADPGEASGATNSAGATGRLLEPGCFPGTQSILDPSQYLESWGLCLCRASKSPRQVGPPNKSFNHWTAAVEPISSCKPRGKTESESRTLHGRVEDPVSGSVVGGCCLEERMGRMGRTRPFFVHCIAYFSYCARRPPASKVLYG